MRALLTGLLFLFSVTAHADDYLLLYQTAGWPQQRANCSEALSAAQQRDRNSLPPALFQMLLENSNRRFAPQAMEQRGVDTLRVTLANPQPALQFFRSPTGTKVVSAEVRAARRDQLALLSQGLPRSQAGADRRGLITRLGKALPAQDAGAEVSLALAGVAADSLSQMLPGLFGEGRAQELMDTQRQRLKAQVGNDLDNTLLYVYRDLNDAELTEYVDFAESSQGQEYYQAALAALRAALAVEANAPRTKTFESTQPSS